MSDKLKSIKVGLISIVSILILYFGINFLKGINVMHDGRIFYAYYDNIGGLTQGSAVTIKGYKIGTVTDINFDKSRDNQLKVEFIVNDDIQIPSNSIARIVSQDLMGTKGISIVLGDLNEDAYSGSELIPDIEASLQEEVNSQILPLKNKTEQLIGSIDSVMIVITSVLNKEARSSLTKSLVSLDNTFTTLSSTMMLIDKMVYDNQQNVNSIFKNVSGISENLDQSNNEIKNILSNISSLSDSLKHTNLAATINKIDKITNKINNNEGSLGMLVNDKELYENLKSASQELDALILDFKDHPSKYINFSILGKKKKTSKSK